MLAKIVLPSCQLPVPACSMSTVKERLKKAQTKKAPIPQPCIQQGLGDRPIGEYRNDARLD